MKSSVNIRNICLYKALCYLHHMSVYHETLNPNMHKTFLVSPKYIRRICGVYMYQTSSHFHVEAAVV